ncbi:putative NADP-dependent isocitrate dehydrogenase [Fistulina hepatica ATCC 64428]|uniref:Isocitrate dehydrogenase [NADP] n=1 Tax=Fistulina hepatica ATCC 64428 TaxID=1128425 RepID=A0A0D7A5Z8_9AGAR|nr:putative NADP-dependent isocitrate dehydrogenase [Fistulina hepatica ATCC 64428]
MVSHVFFVQQARQKVVIQNPVVELDDDEVARIIRTSIKEKFIAPYLELDMKYYDLGLSHHDATLTVEAAKATQKYKVGIKRATITPDEVRVKEFNLKKMWKSTNGTSHDTLVGTVFCEPIILLRIPKPTHDRVKPIIIGRHTFGDQYRPTDFAAPKPGRLQLLFMPADSDATSMYNTDESIMGFAHTFFKMVCARRMPLFMSTKNTILKKYDGRFKDISQEIYENISLEAGICYERRLIDDMVIQVIKSSGGFVLACKNYDGFGSWGMLTSELITSDRQIIKSEAAHGKRTRGLLHRPKLDSNGALRKFCLDVEATCVEVIDKDGIMTKDLALAIHGKEMKHEYWVVTNIYMDAVKLLRVNKRGVR